MDFFPFEFEGVIETHDIGSGTYTYTVIWLPSDLAETFSGPGQSRPRIVGEIDHMPIDGALHPVSGRIYILLSKKKLAKLKKQVGDSVRVAFRPDDAKRVEIPSILLDAIHADPELEVLWTAQTPGKQRSLAHMVGSAKTRLTQEKRIEKVRMILRGEIDLRGNPL